MSIYIAIDNDNGEIKAFTDFYSLKKFADKHEYQFDYFKLGQIEEEYNVEDLIGGIEGEIK